VDVTHLLRINGKLGFVGMSSMERAGPISIAYPETRSYVYLFFEPRFVSLVNISAMAFARIVSNVWCNCESSS
jgi:hypothetical protein